ncbi:hypothetical protein LSTR_LSTR001616 [Laodelphax striatellus]|uniref:Secreted protein n=1 Tax=Laodelphax striatellus TaxID=195883 RepID=A0A482XBL3_LAOST|nr:hypothetical protein LSTR_LSTR001616 [Laodelphax striatellus]
MRHSSTMYGCVIIYVHVWMNAAEVVLPADERRFGGQRVKRQTKREPTASLLEAGTWKNASDSGPSRAAVGAKSSN